MTDEEFKRAAEVAGSNPRSDSYASARMVLVAGMSCNGAARAIGMDTSVVSRSVQRVARCATVTINGMERPRMDIGARVVVWNDDPDKRRYAHFAGWCENGEISVFPNGQSAWSHDGGKIINYKNWSVTV
jgi:hypothetical protein